MAAPDVKKPARCGPGCRTTQKLRLQFSLNCGSMEIMLKSRAIELFGGGITAIADAIGVTYQAVDKWPDVLPARIADRVIAACVRAHIEIPADLIEQGAPATHASA